MILARVLGTTVATHKHPAYQGRTVLVCQPLSPEGTLTGSTFLSVDFALAGAGDTVLIAREGNASRQLFEDDLAPAHSVILGVVDEVDTEGDV